MKRLLTIVLAVILCTAFCSCSNAQNKNSSNDAGTAVSVTKAENYGYTEEALINVSFKYIKGEISKDDFIKSYCYPVDIVQKVMESQNIDPAESGIEYEDYDMLGIWQTTAPYDNFDSPDDFDSRKIGDKYEIERLCSMTELFDEESDSEKTETVYNESIEKINDILKADKTPVINDFALCDYSFTSDSQEIRLNVLMVETDAGFYIVSISS